MRSARLFLTAAILFLAVVGVSAQTARKAIEADPAKASHVFNMYPEQIPEHARPPKGFKPFYISHYGRHGARNNGSDSDFVLFRDMLEEAYQAGNLTPAGEEARLRFQKAFPKLYLRGGDLSSKGWRQHHDIATRMMTDYPEVFRGKEVRVDARSTAVPRCIMSMAAFCDALKERNTSLQISQNTGAWLVNPLNPFTIANPDCHSNDAGFENRHAAWNRSYHAWRRKLLHPEVFFGNLFKDTAFLKKYAPNSLYPLEETLISMSGTMQCSDVDISLVDLYPFEEVYNNYLLVNYKYYASKGPDTLIQKGRQWALVLPFFDDLLSCAESDMASGDVAVRLRFGHDITLMSMMTFLDVDGWNKPASDPWEIAEYWNCYRVPMASNAQFIFYRNRRGEILVRMMYNEADVFLPIEPELAPYYRWEDFRNFCLARKAVARHILDTTKPPKS